MRIARDKSGQITDIGKPDAPAESVMQIRATQVGQPEKLEQVQRGIESVLNDVRTSVGDFREMRARLHETIEEIDRKKLPVDEDERAEIARFLKWIEDDHFTFLGYREYAMTGKGEKASYQIVDGRSLGILKDFNLRIFGGMRNQESMPTQVRSYLRQPKLLLITKANTRATVHRDVPMDVFGVKTFDAKGNVTGERLFAGLFTSAAYSRSPREIPMLDRKIETIIERAGFSADSHDGKALAHILETYPRDELFQASEDELLETAVGILNLQERQRVALFVRRDLYERFVTALIFLPKDTMNTAAPPRDAGGGGEGVQRHALRLLRASGRRRAGAAAVHHRDHAGPDPGGRSQGPRSETGRRRALLGRPSARCAGRGQGRSRGHGPAAALSRRFPGRLRRSLQRARRRPRYRAGRGSAASGRFPPSTSIARSKRRPTSCA